MPTVLRDYQFLLVRAGDNGFRVLSVSYKIRALILSIKLVHLSPRNIENLDCGFLSFSVTLGKC
jgi:hypothetical protein